MENKITVSKKDKAVELLKQLNVFSGFIRDFEEKNLVCYFEHFIGFWDFQTPEIEKKRKEIEQRFNCLVYAITHEFTEFGELYSFLLVTNYPEEWDELLDSEGNQHVAFAYVWNKDDDTCSELGSIMVESEYGGIRRIS